MADLLLGVDSGNTVTKAVLFSAEGVAHATGSVEIAQIKPGPRLVERDMEAHWQGTAAAIRRALDGVDPGRIAAVTVTGHGDGLYPVDAEGAPLGHGILSLDTRAAGIVAGWEADGTAAAALSLTGQMPYPPAPSALLAWIRDRQPERYARIGHVLSCKDWLRLRLTGAVATDWTEASTSFVDPASQVYSHRALELFGLGAMGPALPPALDPCAILGPVTEDAAAATGLRHGTPVAVGLHDVTASAVGSGVVAPGSLSVIAGSFSINQAVSAEPVFDPQWLCRSSFKRGEWMNMALSPASSANIDWFVKECCRDVLDAPFERLEPEIAAAFEDESFNVFHPFLYGSPHGPAASGAFLGLQGWHHRGHLLRAVFEGVVFNHRVHIDALRRAFPVQRARLTGGSSRSERICQLFADATGLTIETVETEETGALGAALCGAVGVGLFPNLAAAARECVRLRARHAPQANLDAQFGRYRAAAEALAGQWPSLRGEA